MLPHGSRNEQRKLVEEAEPLVCIGDLSSRLLAGWWSQSLICQQLSRWWSSCKLKLNFAVETIVNYTNTFILTVVGTACRFKTNPYSFGYLIGALHILKQLLGFGKKNSWSFTYFETTIEIWEKTVDSNNILWSDFSFFVQNMLF